MCTAVDIVALLLEHAWAAGFLLFMTGLSAALPLAAGRK